jgi:glycosyltransferase involved in cell wall biosynthesis
LISCILSTARHSFPIIGLPNVHIFEPTLRSLEKQAFKDFELIIVDALYPERKEWIERTKWSFPIKYVPVHANHRFWLDHKRWGVCGQLNTALLHCQGDLVVRLDDCSEFDADFLQKFVEGYQNGYFPLAMHTRYRNGSQAYYNESYRQEGYDFAREDPDRKKILSQVYNEGNPVRDTRWSIVEKRGGHMIAPQDWFYGYSSFTLEVALKINGFNELFDGDKGQEDQEFGLRLSMAGYKNMFCLDTSHWVIEHEHEPIPAGIVARDVNNVKCNYAIYLLNQMKNRWRANSELLTEEDLRFIVAETLKPPCSPRQGMYEDDCQGDLFKLWASHQPIFDLREERLNI